MAQSVVAFGGGHGLFATLQALRRLPVEITAVVTVADDGGSSGRLRHELDCLPPGDLRQALVALAGETTTARLLQHRFSGGGGLTQHAVGNLLLAGAFEVFGEPVAALDHVGALLGAVGRVLPMATVPLQIEAEVTGLGGAEPAIVRGQAEVAVTKGDVQRVRLLPEAPPACPEVLEAIASASLLIFGPGSWFTSVLPHLLVPELAEAIHASSARRVVVLNLAPETETSGWGIADHLAALLRHEPRFRADVVIADEGVAARGERACWEEAAASVGGSLLVEPLAAGGGARHDPVALGRVLGRVLGP